MKKFYKLIPLLSLAVVVPTVFSLTSCGVTHATTYDLTGQALENKTAVKNLKHGPSLKTLLYGDKGFHKGNYVLFLSSTCAPPINRVLFGNSNTVFGNDSTIGNDSATLTKNNFDSINDFIANHNSKKEDTGFVWLNRNDITWDDHWYRQYDTNPNTGVNFRPVDGKYYVLPFSKWSKDDEQHYEYGKKDYKKCKEGQWVRKDNGANNWRWITQTYLSKLFGISGDNSFVMMQWVQGKMIANIAVPGYDAGFSNDELLNGNDFVNWVTKNYMDHAKNNK